MPICFEAMKDKNVILKFNNAIRLEREGYYLKALTEYIQVIQMDHGYREAYVNLGSLYSRMNKLSEAMRCYNSALALGRDFITYFNMGSIHYKMGNYKRAVMFLEKSRKLNENFTLSTLVMGLCYSRLNSIKAAKKNFLRVLKSWPDNRVALTALSIIFYNDHQYQDSLRLLNILLQSDNDNKKVREFKSNVLYSAGRLEESAHEFKTLTRISDGYRYFNEYIKTIPVEVYTDRYGSLEEKIEFLQEKNDSNSLFSLSLCHLFKGETDKAIDYLFEVKKQFPG